MGRVYEYIDGKILSSIQARALLGEYGAMDRAMTPSKLLPNQL
jgi:hypothetical protein